MTQEDKELLLKDLCARLPYEVKGLYQWKGNKPFDRELTGTLYDELFSSLNSTGDSTFSPYLRPMSSMTEEERNEFHDWRMLIDELLVGQQAKYFDWLNSHHLDYRGLIEKGLALEAPEGMYKIWNSRRGNLKEDNQGNIVGGLKL